MRLHTQILAGTALGLLVGTLTSVAPTIAAPAPVAPVAADKDAPVLLAQAQPAEEERREEEAAPGMAAPDEPAARPAEPAQAAEPETDAEPEVEQEAPAEPAAEPAPQSEPEPQVETLQQPEAPTIEPPREQDADAEAGEPAAPDASEPDTSDSEPAPGDARISAPPVVPDDAEDVSEPPVVPDQEDDAGPTPGDAEISAPPVVPDRTPGISDVPAPAGEAAPAPAPAADEDAPEAGGTPPIGDETISAPPVVPSDEETGLPENAAPILDSAKEDFVDGARDDGEPRIAAPEEEMAPPPEDDASALVEEARPVDIQSAVAEEGRRIRREADDVERRERPDGAEVLRQIGDRIVIQFNNQTIVESSDRPRLSRDAREVYYEELPRGREREVIVRGDGTQVVTIRNRYGDVVRRSRIMPDGREIVLSYVDERSYDRVRDWRDPGRDLPPLRLAIPAREYILDARRAQDADDYYDFLYQPPVERVQRLYSVDEVRRSARIRDTVRRVDLDTITFDFGAASIGESEIRRLEDVATAMERLLERNPAETFLIEGHTDAVGSDLANLALSDRRAESVADALTNVFGIPPENLVTQGYGERYLKVQTQEPERLNRRVAIRRITPLIAPVASAN